MTMIDVEVTGVAEIRHALTHPDLFDEPLKALFTTAAAHGVLVAVRGIDGGMGVAVRSIQGYVNPTNARVVSRMARVRALNIERGRRSGEVVPIAALIRWKTAVGHPDSAIEIQQRIRRRGVRGRFFMRAVRESWKAHKPIWLAETARAIEAKWAVLTR